MKKKTWFEEFSSGMNVVFTKKDFDRYFSFVKRDIAFFRKYLKKGSKILDAGCGLGCTAIPLSLFGYKVTGIEIENKVLECAKINAEKFGKKGNVKILKGDLYEIDRIFKKDSFDAVIHGGTIEHFPEKDISKLLMKQLKVAPLVIGNVPVFGKNERKKWDRGIYMNKWTTEYWLKVLKDFSVVEHRKDNANKTISGLDEFTFVIKRK